MNYKELIDPELRKSANSFPFNPAIVAVGNLYQDLEWGRTKVPEGMEETEIVTEGTQNLSVKTTVFSMAGAQEEMPALIYVHGGAFAYKAAAYQKKLAMIYAEEAGCRVTDAAGLPLTYDRKTSVMAASAGVAREGYYLPADVLGINVKNETGRQALIQKGGVSLCLNISICFLISTVWT